MEFFSKFKIYPPRPTKENLNAFQREEISDDDESRYARNED